MEGSKRNFSLSIWDHKDNFLCLLKSPDEDINGQSYDEEVVEDIYGEKTLSFSGKNQTQKQFFALYGEKFQFSFKTTEQNIKVCKPMVIFEIEE